MTIGIDIGGTKTALGLVSGSDLVESEVIPTGTFDETVPAAVDRLKTWIESQPVSAVGIACTGPIDPDDGSVVNGDTLAGWVGKNVRKEFCEALDLPCCLLNDADGALLGELFAGALKGKDHEPAVMLTFGTGVGGAAWNGSKLLAGAYGEHPEIGHILIRPGGPACYCGAKGCLESVAGGVALEAVAAHAKFAGVPELVAAADAMDENALNVLKDVRLAIEDALWTLTHVLRPASFVLGGGVMEKIHRYLMPPSLNVTPSTVPGKHPAILLAKLGNQAGMVGAAIAAARQN